jgi:flagellar protein FliL
MADDKEKVGSGESPEGENAAKPGEKAEGKKGKKSGGGRSKLLLILLPVAVIALGAGGYFGYTVLSHGKGKPAAHAKAGHDANAKAVLFSVDPFVVNLSEPGRYLKVTMQFELAGESDQAAVTERVPILRDTIITLLGNQTYEYAASAEGKVQLKDEILLRTNRIFGREVFRNLYFTDFVMQ